MGVVSAFLDGTDVTSITKEGSVTKELNGTATSALKVYGDLTSAGETSKLKVTLNGGLDFHGTVEHVEDEGDEDEIYTVLTAADPSCIWPWRPVRDSDGDFTKPSIIDTFNTGPQIMQQAFQNSETYEGTLFLQLGSFASGGVNLSGAPTDWPMTLAELHALLVATGELDVILTPIDSGGDLARVDCYNGNYGSDLTGSVRFEYVTGLFNAIGCRRTIDKSELCNKLWYYGGPRRFPASDPAGDQHWAFNITSTDPGLANPPQSAISSAMTASRALYGVRMDIKIFDGDGVATVRELYRRLWQTEAWLRLKPKKLIHIKPQPGIAPAFGVGDLIYVGAGTKFRGGFSGTQRVYRYTYRWDENGTVELGEPVGQAGAAAVVTSADAEGLPS